MNNKVNHKQGFTLIELIMVIVVLGILAAVAVPKFIDLSAEAKGSAEKGVVGGIRAGLQTYYTAPATRGTFPATLDAATNAACATANACFTTVLGQGGTTSDWTRVSNTSYTGPTGATYTYTPATGSFD